jgi:predicted DNA-binding transcriptional regulator AlpA
MMTMKSDDDLLTGDQVIAEELKGTMSLRTLEQKRLAGNGPPFLKIGALVRYRRSEVRAWLDRCRRTSTSDTGRR